MRREQGKTDKRAQYVLDQVNERPIPVTRCVKQLADELFLSERTVWYDLNRALGNDSSRSKY